CDCLLWIASVVADRQRQLLAEQPAMRVDVLHRLDAAAAHLLADRGVGAGDWSRDRDLDVIGTREIGGKADGRGQRKCQKLLHFLSVPLLEGGVAPSVESLM